MTSANRMHFTASTSHTIEPRFNAKKGHLWLSLWLSQVFPIQPFKACLGKHSGRHYTTTATTSLRIILLQIAGVDKYVSQQTILPGDSLSKEHKMQVE